MKIKYRISKPNDEAKYTNSSFLFDTSDKTLFPSLYSRKKKSGKIGYYSGALNHFGERVIQTPRLTITATRRMKDDPVLTSLRTSVGTVLLPTKNTETNFVNRMTFKYVDGESVVLYSRRNKSYYVDFEKMNKTDACLVLAKIILRASLARSVEIMDDYIDRCVTYPPNVLYVLENRTPYTFYIAGVKQEVRINTKLINEKECALEISEGIWGAIQIKDMNTFINTFKNNSSKSKIWSKIAPRDLWIRLMGNTPTVGQEKLMIAWLQQNRTSDMIDNRATQLLFDLDHEYENLHFVQFHNPTQKALFVRGKASDWVIADERRGMKAGHQRVNTYQLMDATDYTDGHGRTWNNMGLSGPICIDNLHNNSSVGDQLSARAMLLLNDASIREMVYTLRGRITDDMISGKFKSPRLDLSTLNAWNEKESLEYKVA